MLNVLIIAKQPIFRRGLIAILESTSDIHVVGEAGDLREAILIEEIAPNIVLLDIDELGKIDGELVNLLQQRHIHAKIIVLTDSAREDTFVEAMKCGVKGYLLKSSTLEKMVDSIRLVAEGDTAVFAGEANMLLCNICEVDKRSSNGTGQLSPREREILCRIARGETTKEVAAACYISQTTVKAHVAKILYKLDVKNRSEAVAIAVEQGLLDHVSGKEEATVKIA